MTGVKEVFPEAEHRECMFHLVTNFKKKFHGKVFDDHLWAARSEERRVGKECLL